MSQCNHDAVLVISIFCGFSVLIALAVMYGFRSLRHQNEALKSENATLKFAASHEGRRKHQAKAREKSVSRQIYNGLNGKLDGLAVSEPKLAYNDYESHRLAEQCIFITDLRNNSRVMQVSVSTPRGVYLEVLHRKGRTFSGHGSVDNQTAEVVIREAKQYAQEYFESHP